MCQAWHSIGTDWALTGAGGFHWLHAGNRCDIDNHPQALQLCIVNSHRHWVQLETYACTIASIGQCCQCHLYALSIGQRYSGTTAPASALPSWVQPACSAADRTTSTVMCRPQTQCLEARWNCGALRLLCTQRLQVPSCASKGHRQDITASDALGSAD
jgi:hypothetical protein